MHTKIRNKMRSIGLPLPKSRGALLVELAHEMKLLKEELDESTESSSDPKKDSTPTCQMTTEVPTTRHQRHSLIGLLTGDGHHQSKSAPTHDVMHSQVKESSSSHSSTPNQAPNLSETQEPPNGQSTQPDRSSQRSSVSDDHGPLPKSESLLFHKAHKLRFVSSVEFRHSSGETSTTPLSPGSPAEDSSGEIYPNKPRLQRIKPQSRKTFRIRKSKKNRQAEIAQAKLDAEASQASLRHQDSTSPPQTPPVTIQSQESSQHPASTVHTQAGQKAETPTPQRYEPLTDSHRLRIATRSKAAEGSWDEDSAISQTSSTSGYRESYPVMLLKEPLESSPKAFPPLASPDIHSLPSTSSATTTNNFMLIDNSSPDCSLNENGEKTALLAPEEKSSSHQSLMMVFDGQDENTLI